MVAKTISEIPTDRFKLSVYLSFTVIMFASVTATYLGISVFGVSPSWTVEQAVKNCLKKEWIHLDTTPFFSIMRYIGYFFGTGIGLFLKRNSLDWSLLNKMIVISLSFFACRFFDGIKIPNDNMKLFYSIAFGVNVILPVLFIAVIPRIVDIVFPTSSEASRKRKRK
jgi:glucose-6-phosphatase